MERALSYVPRTSRRRTSGRSPAAWLAASCAAIALLALTGCSSPKYARGGELAGDTAAPNVMVPDAPWRTLGSEASGHVAVNRSSPVLLQGARLLLGDGREIPMGHLLMHHGRIVSIGAGMAPSAPHGTQIIDARGKTVTPGLIDTHSHLGVYPTPSVAAHNDGNEMTKPVTPGARAVDAFWPQDPGIQRAVAGGVTTIQVLPGSGNLIGGRAVTLKLRPARTSREMYFVGAPDGLKMACGENPKRVYGGRKQMPMTRMGNIAMQREAFMKARRLIDEWDQWRRQERKRLQNEVRANAKTAKERRTRARRRAACASRKYSASRCLALKRAWEKKPVEDDKGKDAKLPPKRDVHLETLAAVLEGKILVHVHCYRADDMANMIALAKEQGFQIRSFHHALEAYKIRARLAYENISVSTWADWWGFKMEAYDGIPENLAMVASAGARAVVHSDSRIDIRRLNQEAAKGMFAGRNAKINVSEGDAMTWITLNPAWALGVDRWVGSLAIGKDADVVIWDRNPFSVYARAERVFIDGIERHNAKTPGEPWSDFEAAP